MLHLYRKHNEVFLDYEDVNFNEYYTDYQNWSNRVLSYIKLIEKCIDKTIVAIDMLEFICRTFHNVIFTSENNKSKLTLTFLEKIREWYYKHNLQNMNEYHYRLSGKYID